MTPELPPSWLREMLNKAIRDEREACAKVAEKYLANLKMEVTGEVLANTIRSRTDGETG